MVNVIWQTYYEELSILFNSSLSQFEYIDDVVFKHLPHKNYFDHRRCKKILNNSIIIFSEMFFEMEEDVRKYLDKYDELNYNYILFHISNEFLGFNTKYYKNAKHIFRFYYDKNITLNNVTTLPVGFITGYLNKQNEIVPSKNRDILATFIGQLKKDRQYLVDELYKLDKTNSIFIYTTNKWADPNGLTTKRVIDIYKRTKFIPCPIGNHNVETLRLFEALEWGCIPVLKRYNNEDYYYNLFGDHPIPILNDWDELNYFMLSFDDEKTDKLIKELNDWYINYKDDMSLKVAKIVTDTFNIK